MVGFKEPLVWDCGRQKRVGKLGLLHCFMHGHILIKYEMFNIDVLELNYGKMF